MPALLDANILVSLVSQDALTTRTVALLEGYAGELVVTDYVLLETASAVALKVRRHDLLSVDADYVLKNIDQWTGRQCSHAPLLSEDIARAGRILRGFTTGLRTADAIHIAIAFRLGCVLATFDAKMARDARGLGLTVLD